MIEISTTNTVVLQSKDTRKFYVYAHYRLTDGVVFYIGKGRGRRAFATHGRTSLWNYAVAKHGLRVEIWAKDLTEYQAFEMEKVWIALYGRKDLNNGPLTNFTNGGEGASGVIPGTETRLKMSVKGKGRVKSPEHRAKIGAGRRGRKMTPEQCAKISAARKGKGAKKWPLAARQGHAGRLGRPHSEETKEKIRRSKIGTKASLESRAKMSAFQQTRVLSEEHKAKIGNASRGRKHTEESKAKLSKAHTGKKANPEAVEKTAAANRGRKMAPEHRAKLSAFHKGVPKSEEHKAKLRAANLGKKLDPERVAKMVATNTGRKRSPETRAKMREASLKTRLAKNKKAQQEKDLQNDQ